MRSSHGDVGSNSLDDFPPLAKSVPQSRSNLTQQVDAGWGQRTWVSSAHIKSAWDRRMDRDRIAQEIKQHLFSAPSIVDFHDLDVAASQLESALSRIPAPRQDLNRSPAVPDQGDGVLAGGGISNSVDGARPPSYSNGLSHEAIYDHSWKPIGPRWLWISKSSAVEGVGFPARKDEILRFGHLARRVRRLGKPPPLRKSFAEAL